MSRIVLLATLFLFSGCAITNQSQEQTIAAVMAMQQSINNKLDIVNSDLQKQLDVSLQEQDKKIETLQSSTQKSLANLEKAINSKEDKKMLEVAKLEPTRVTNLRVLGEAEWVQIEGIEGSLDARVDTGASVSSISAINIEEFERNSKKWVRFTVKDKKELKEGENVIEAPIVRVAHIKQSSSNTAQERVVVRLWITLGNIREHSEFSLIDRSHLEYPVLLGREFMRDIAVVDVSKKYIESKQD